MKSPLLALGLLVFGWPAYAASEFTSPLSAQLPVSGEQRAFPTAEGFGARSTGGRGGSVCKVTSLSDSGAGTLRNCLEVETGARTVIFDIGGTITLNDRIDMSAAQDGQITIAGQTAPGEGICLRGGGIYMEDTSAPRDSGDIIIRHLCIRIGDQTSGGVPRSDADCFTFVNIQDVIFDHVSCYWTQDESMQVNGSSANRTTVQYSLFAEPLNGKIDAGNFPHAMGPMFFFNADEISFHHNVIAHFYRRGPLNQDTQDVDSINNIVYNWQHTGATMIDAIASEVPQRINWQNSIYERGPDTETDGSDPSFECDEIDGATNADLGELYIDGNTRVDGTDADADFQNEQNRCDNTLATSAFAHDADDSVTMTTAAVVWNTLLPQVGAIVPTRDPVDADMIATVETGTGQVIDCVDLADDSTSVLIDPCVVEASYGSHYIHPTVTRPAGYDTDDDGMPDDWESDHGLDPNDATDRNGDFVGDGWNNLEYFLNQLAGDYRLAGIESDPGVGKGFGR